MQDAGGKLLSEKAVAAVKGVKVDTLSNSTYDFAWAGTQKGFPSQAAARTAFLDVLSGVSPYSGASSKP